jgi:ankyrin repeat protein
VVQTLLTAKAEVEVRDDAGETPLHFAALSGSVKIVEALLKANADVSAKCVRGRTPLDIAVAFKRTEVSQLLRDAILAK